MREELKNLVNFIKKRFLKNKVNELNFDLKRAETDGNDDEILRTIKQIQVYSEKLAQLK